MIEKKIREFNQRYGLENKKLLLAVSGGVDSIVLFDIYQRLGLNIAVASLDHGLRKESEKEINYLRKLTAASGIPFYTKKLLKAPKNEAAAREARYKFLNESARNFGADYILTAHHMDDQVETYLLKLVRGVGPLDLGGMTEVKGNLLRPMLEIPKSDIQDYAKKNKLKYFTDKTNTDIKFSRNRIRNKIIPDMEKLNPNLKNQILKSLKLEDEEKKFVKEEVARVLRKVTEGERLDLEKYENLKNSFLKNEVLKEYLKKTIGENDIYQKNIQEIRKLLESRGTKRGQVRGTDFTKDYEFLLPTPPKTKQDYKKKLKNNTEFNGFIFKLSETEKETVKNNIFLPLELTYNLNIRTWKPGDKINTPGGTKKVQDIFTDAKISQTKRKRWPVIVGGNELVWVPLLAKNKKYQSRKEKNMINIVVEEPDAREKV